MSLPLVFGGVNLAKNSVNGRGRMFQSTCRFGISSTQARKKKLDGRQLVVLSQGAVNGFRACS